MLNIRKRPYFESKRSADKRSCGFNLDTTLEQSVSNTVNKASTDQRISVNVVTTGHRPIKLSVANVLPSQTPVVTTGYRDDAALGSRRERRAEPQYEQQAQQIQRRHTGKQQFQ